MDFLYLPRRQHPRPRMVLLAESAGDPASLAAPLREALRGLDANKPIFNVRTMEEFYDMRVVSTGNVIVRIVEAMGVMGLALALVGLYSLGAYAVSRRTREIGIRMAIGASRGMVLAMTLRQSLAPALIGVLAGLGPAFFQSGCWTRFSRPTRTQTLPLISWWTPALIAIALLRLSFRRGGPARVDPMQALRHE